MIITDSMINEEPIKQKRGWNRRGFKWDKTSPEYQEYRRKCQESMSKKTRIELERRAKEPLSGRIFKSKKK